ETPSECEVVLQSSLVTSAWSHLPAMPPVATTSGVGSGAASKSRLSGHVRIAAMIASKVSGRTVTPAGIVNASRLLPAMRILLEGRFGIGSFELAVFFGSDPDV